MKPLSEENYKVLIKSASTKINLITTGSNRISNRSINELTLT